MRDKRFFALLLAICLSALLGGCGLTGGGDSAGRREAGDGGGAKKAATNPPTPGSSATPSPASTPLGEDEFARQRQALLNKIAAELEKVKEKNEANKKEVDAIKEAATNTLTIKYKNLTEDYRGVAEGQEKFLGEVQEGIAKLSPPAQPSAGATGEPFLTLTFTKWTALFVFFLFLIFGGIVYLGQLLVRRTRDVLEAADNSVDLFKSIDGRLDGLKAGPLVRPGGGAMPPEVKKWLEDVEYKIDAVCEDAKKAAGKPGAGSTVESTPQPPAPPVTTPARGSRIASDSFPVQADEYLQKMRGRARIVRPDFGSDLLVLDAEGKSEWVLIDDRETDGGLFYVIPRDTYVQAKQDFLVHYNEYYDCERPQRGQVWILRPAVVTRVGDGWKLGSKGELEMR